MSSSIIIHSPYPLDTTQGNTITARRLEQILLDDGKQVIMEEVIYQGAIARSMIALNAWRSADAVSQYQKANPQGKVVVIITGSDINNEEMDDAQSPTRMTMAAADALVMLHDIEFEKLPTDLQQKCQVIYPSVNFPEKILHQPLAGSGFQVVMAGNLRPVKNPVLAVEACQLLPADLLLTLSSYGSAEGKIRETVSSASKELMHYQWCGEVTHEALLQTMAAAHLLLNTSIGEGGANAICEAISMGLPVVASDIRGNKGMLGEDYAGFFPSEDAPALAALLMKVSEDTLFYRRLKKQVAARAKLFSYAAETEQWVSLIETVL
ncbi:MAG: glycosyltransferase family 4 protein [Akkermansiaceae bacterium]